MSRWLSVLCLGVAFCLHGDAALAVDPYVPFPAPPQNPARDRSGPRPVRIQFAQPQVIENHTQPKPKLPVPTAVVPRPVPVPGNLATQPPRQVRREPITLVVSDDEQANLAPIARADAFQWRPSPGDKPAASSTSGEYNFQLVQAPMVVEAPGLDSPSSPGETAPTAPGTFGPLTPNAGSITGPSPSLPVDSAPSQTNLGTGNLGAVSPADNPLANFQSNQNNFNFAQGNAASAAGTAAGVGLLASMPYVIGDFFDGGSRLLDFTDQVSTSFFADGVVVTSGSGQIIALERDMMGFPDDVFTNGPGADTNGDSFADTFPIAEPIPPNEVPTSPGSGYVFDGGTAVFTNSTSTTSPVVGIPAGSGTYFVSYSFSQSGQHMIPAGGGGVAVRRFKISENQSPIPQDRVFFNYNFFNDVMAGLGDVSRFTLGMEKTYFDQLVSFEFRIPFAGTLDSTQTVDAAGARNFEWGNAVLLWKFLLSYNPRHAWTAGVGVAVPTASDSRVYFADGTPILNVKNESVHLLPYIAWAFAPTQKMFSEAYVQFDLDLHGNPIHAAVPTLNPLPPGQLPRIGMSRDVDMLFVDFASGYWLFRNRPGFLSGVAPVAELHYSTGLEAATPVSGNGVMVSEFTRRFDVLNLTLGSHFAFGNRVTVAAGMSVPLRSDHDEVFDYEALMHMNVKL